MRIYLDHNAGGPLRAAARKAMAGFIVDGGEGNPASVHLSGQRARRMLEQARADIAGLLGAPSRTLVFTSGGTEANNLAIFGAVQATNRRRLVSSPIEHSSVLAPLGELARRGFELALSAVDHDGRISPARVCELINSETALVSLGLANAEVGTIQDLRGIGASARQAGALFHVDAVQAAGRTPLEVETIGCDLMSISAHKLGGPAGIGVLYVRPQSVLAPQLLGGPQEAGLRAGTPNLPGIIGFAAAARETLASMSEENERFRHLARLLLQQLEQAIPGLSLNGPLAGGLANTLNLTFPGVLGESMLIALDLEGVEVSMGSACAAGAVEPSHVLLAMGRDPRRARSSIRLSLGWSTLAEEIERAAEIIPRVWRRVAAAEPEAGS